MSALLDALRRALRTEWRYTFRSALRENSTRHAVRLWARETWKGLRQLGAYAREIRTARR